MNHTRYTLAIDPGNTETAYVFYDELLRKLLRFEKTKNENVLEMCRNLQFFCGDPALMIPPELLTVAIEFPEPRGQLASWQLFHTVSWAGRYHEALDQVRIKLHRVNRMHVKMHLCGVTNAKDPQIRQALIDSFGGEHTILGPKCKKCKGTGHLGRIETQIDCVECDAAGEIPGLRGPKKCPKCKGTKKVYIKTPVPCDKCNGTGQVAPGVLYGVSKDSWQALGVAVTFDQSHYYLKGYDDRPPES